MHDQAAFSSNLRRLFHKLESSQRFAFCADLWDVLTYDATYMCRTISKIDREAMEAPQHVVSYATIIINTTSTIL